MVEIFASHFASVFSRSTAPSEAEIANATRSVPVDLVDMDVFAVSNEMIEKATTKLKSSYSAGPDGIPSAVLKLCVGQLLEPLSMIFNMSLSTGVFPTKWKESFMFPVHKKGDKRNVSNYRGITSLCSVSKLFELVMNDYLFFNCKRYISPDQHGFYPGRSTTTNLMEFTSYCLVNMENGFQVDAVYTDLKAAFDRIDRELLLAKLSRLGASARLIGWLRSYLYGRKLRVRLGNSESQPFSNTSGVPQGSNLGPLLFSLYINDLCLLLPNGCRLLFADDLKIFLKIMSLADCRDLQRLVNIFLEWCSWNRITVSVEKCNVISFTRRKSAILYDYSMADETLARVEAVKDLGVTLDCSLHFNIHRSIIIDKANRQLGFIKKICQDFSDPLCLRSLYCALVRPVLETASIVWHPFQNVWTERIEQVQKRFVRFALRNLPWNDPFHLPPYAERCRLLSIGTISTRRRIAQAVFAAKILKGETDCAGILSQFMINLPERTLRQRDFFRQTFHRTDYGRHEPISSVCSAFVLAYDLFEFDESISVFRNKLTDSRLFES